MTNVKRKKGKRIDRTYQRRYQPYRDYSKAREVNPRVQERSDKPGAINRKDRMRLRQLIVSAVILIAVVAVKLLAPQVLEEHRTRLQGLLGENTDFVAAFSAIGKAVGIEDGIGEALNDAYTAVFGSAEVENSVESSLENTSAPVYTEDNLPENVEMMQTVLGFSYTTPLAATLTDKFGYRIHPIDGNQQFHYGLDLEAPEGTVIGSFAEGRVSIVGESSQLGKYVTVVHAGDYTTLYAHCSRITASAGQQVKLGDPIAEVGETGQATGPHLHFELYRDTTYYNPIYYVSV